MRTVEWTGKLTQCVLVLALACGIGLVYSAKAQQEGPKPDPQRVEGQDLKAKLEHLRATLREVTGAGRMDEAEEIKRHIGEIEQQLEKKMRPDAPPREIAEAKERLQHMKGEIEELRKAGRHDAAERLEREARELAEKVRPGESRRPDQERMRQPQPERMDRPAPEARRQAIVRRAAVQEGMRPQPPEAMPKMLTPGVRRPMPEGIRPPAPPPGSRPEMRAAQRERAEAERRLAHLKAAIENLHAAGLHEPAEHLLREAEQIKQHLQGPPGPLPPELERAKATVYRLQAEINELRQAVQELRKRVDELTEKRR